MAVSTNKMIGFVASLLTVLSLIYTLVIIPQLGFPSANASPFTFVSGLFFAPLGIVGFILFLVVMYGFSKDYRDDRIFNYVLYGFIASIVIAGIVFAIAIALLFSSLGGALFSTPTGPSNFGTQFLQDFFESFLPLYVVGSIVGLVPALFNMFAFRKLAKKSEVRLFRTVGLIGVVAAAVGIVSWFLGAALFYAGTVTIYNIFTLSIASSVVSLIAWILAAKAFYSVNVLVSQTQVTPPAQTQPTSTGQVKYCPYCGTANALDAEFCVGCGRKL
jgi:uncharacterized membrane protein